MSSPYENLSLSGQRALVSGASRGIGAADGRARERGWALVYRKNFHDGIWNTAMTGELQCFPGRCSAGLGFSLGVYF